MTLGEKIQKLRREKGLSQEALAEKLAVTRQTISKWELGQSLPDLNFIAGLCSIFEVSSDYLIKNENEMGIQRKAAAPKKRPWQTAQRKRLVWNIFSAAAVAACCICLIVDYFTAEKLLWSWIAAASIGAAWLVLLPLFTAKEKLILKALQMVGAASLLLLAVLALLLKKSIIFKLGSCIALAVFLAVWIIYQIFQKSSRRYWRAAGFSLWVMIPLPILINFMAAYFIKDVQIEPASVLLNSAITFLLSLLCFGADFVSRKEKQK